MNTKRPLYAFLLSLIFPGLGLAYLGKWPLAIIAFVCTLATGAMFLLALEALNYPETLVYQYRRYAVRVLIIANGAFAFYIAKTTNAKRCSPSSSAQ